MKAYTGTGDKGETSLYGGTRVGKENPRIEANGEVDELNSQIGVVRSLVKDEGLRLVLKNVQEDLWILGGDLSEPIVNAKIPRISDQQLARLEAVTDKLNAELRPLRRFILPGGSPAAAEVHVARSVCRRAERRIVALSRTESINPQVIPYVNRLSSFLFVLAREVNRREGVAEEEFVRS